MTSVAGCSDERDDVVEMTDASTIDLQQVISRSGLVRPGRYSAKAVIEDIDVPVLRKDDPATRRAIDGLKSRFSDHTGWNFDLCAGDEGIPSEVLIMSADGCEVPSLRLSDRKLEYRLACIDTYRDIDSIADFQMEFGQDGYRSSVDLQARTAISGAEGGSRTVRGKGSIEAKWVGECGQPPIIDVPSDEAES